MTAEDAAQVVNRLAHGRDILLAGSGGSLLAERLGEVAISPVDTADPIVLARLAAAADPAPLSPIYLRAPDAKLPV